MSLDGELSTEEMQVKPVTITFNKGEFHVNTIENDLRTSLSNLTTEVKKKKQKVVYFKIKMCLFGVFSWFV